MRPVAAEEENLNVATVDAAWGFIKRSYFDQTFNGQDWAAARERFLERARRGEKAEAITREMVASLQERYSRVVDAGTFEQLMAYDPLGVGAVLTRNSEKEVVVSNPPFKGSSAASAGIKQGDVVLTIDGNPAGKESLFTLMDRVAQADLASVKLELRRGPADVPSKAWELTLPRARTTAPQGKVDYGVAPASAGGNRVGYMRLKTFGARSALDVSSAVQQLRADGANALVLDLRGNPGGSFQVALELAALFLDPDSVATRVQTPGGVDLPVRVTPSPGAAPIAKEPLVLLVDERSASASEVLAAALRGNCRAPLLGGQRTFGKAKVQGVFGLPNKEALALTVAKYSGPAGNAIGEGLPTDGPGPDPPSARVAAAMGLTGDLAPSDYAGIDFDAAVQAEMRTCKPAEAW